MTREFYLIALAFFISFLSGYSEWFYEDDIQRTNFYMLCSAISGFLFLLAALLMAKDKWVRLLLSGGVILMFGEVLDELFFDPLKIGWSDLIILVIVVTNSIFRAWKILITKSPNPL